MRPNDILEFWFNELEPKQWWQKNEELDQAIKERFGSYHQAAIQCELYQWRNEAKGLLAEIIILDQFSRNIFRNKPQAFAKDAQALVLSQFAVAQGLDKDLSSVERQFLYMPYMHSESKLIHEQAVPLFKSLDSDQGYDFELKHKEIIDRFGRYPHRNEVLGRKSTDDELEFLKHPGSSF
ncbi:DUF924 domain-containing protein [Kangiella sp. HD9-110m-PIT-SAG06]|nr:DUF924 domain-containing protein [Kangiella sp. HD9-110m-PIT-SAG06]RDX35559.1 DUF924 domain-containing protein [Kangiella sp. HD9-110m-PIT-SAG07]